MEKVLIVVRVDIEPGMEEEFNSWYDKEHIPNILKVPGVLNAKRAKRIDGNGPKYLAVYEHADVNVRQSDAYMKAVDTEWTRRIRPYFHHFETLLYNLI